jgi:hypothetical protein
MNQTGLPTNLKAINDMVTTGFSIIDQRVDADTEELVALKERCATLEKENAALRGGRNGTD